MLVTPGKIAGVTDGVGVAGAAGSYWVSVDMADLSFDAVVAETGVDASAITDAAGIAALARFRKLTVIPPIRT